MRSIKLPVLQRAFDRVRGDLADVGLLADGAYLDRVDCELTRWPSLDDELGWVYDSGAPWHSWLTGFSAGVIYVSWNAPVAARRPGQTLVDTLRHEYAHAWAWLDRRFVDGPWFRQAFGASYNDDAADIDDTWDREEFVSSYATTSPAEDFAETFMVVLRYRRSLERFRRRRGVWRKVVAVRRAIRTAARERADTIVGPVDR